MIGVVAHADESELVREFFELFKTPWEWYRPEKQYEVVLVAQEDVSPRGYKAKVLVLYSGQESRLDKTFSIKVVPHLQPAVLSYKGGYLPLYGKSRALQTEGVSFLQDAISHHAVGVLRRTGNQIVARMGYDLFREMKAVLLDGQPTEHARIPTVEKHIAVLRDLIVEAGVTLVEIPPVPVGYGFIACLTHDVDHPFMRRHRWDHTMFGFLYRAIFGSLGRVFTRRMPVRHLLANWAAVVKVPFMYIGLAEDPWYRFDRYLDIEKEAASTFFVLPFKNDPGHTIQGPAPQRRASSYGVAELADQLRALVSRGSEIGLHGLDAWLDSSKGRQEREEVARVTGKPHLGVRMHWLYFGADSPEKIEQGGFSYDSTVGYNHTIGYRAGTTQVFRPLGATTLLELPLHIMDTAMFRPNYLNLTHNGAKESISQMIEDALVFGGALTINWHDRSIAPERLWEDFYTWLVAELRRKGAWCTSADCTVRWFQKRRTVKFREGEQSVEITPPQCMDGVDDALPGLRLRIHNSRMAIEDYSPSYVDTSLEGALSISLPGMSIPLNPVAH
jgi:hypothetical protein